MRISLLLAVALLSGCGTWSNEDLEYLYALPQKDALKSQLGNSATHKQPLGAGDPSDAYDELKKGSDGFNAFLDGVLTGLDNIRKVPPTTRQENSRIWGPYADDKHPGFDVLVQITRVDSLNFNWEIRMRPRMGEFFVVGGGSFLGSETLRKGKGTMFFDGKTAREKLMDAGKPGDPDRIDIKYATDGDPVKVNIDFVLPATVTAGYAFNGFADGSAVLQWVVTNPQDLNATKVSFVAGWDTATAGVADFVILQGKWASAMGRQCWDSAHTISYAKGYNDSGPFEVGDKTKCITVHELMPLP